MGHAGNVRVRRPLKRSADILFISSVVTTALMDGYELSVGEKWANLYRALRRPTGNINVVERPVSL